MSTQSRPDGPTKLLGERSVREKTSLSDVTRWRLRKAGKFPEPITISPGRVAWRESDIDAWIEARARETELRRVG